MEKIESQPPDGLWKKRGSEENPYRARRVSHESNTNIEYGEKTWTTAQTVRDVMQNHLDAETERYFQQIAATIFDEETLKKYLGEAGDVAEQKRVENLLYGVFMFAKHVGDMSVDAREESQKYLKNLAYNLTLKSAVVRDNSFSPELFLEAMDSMPEERPLVSYKVTDTETNTPVGFVAYETLRDEPMYKLLSNEYGFRYKITGMKVVDRGSGFDAQLSALYISSKKGKRHVRGKYGEGAKMSELHLLRNGAHIKMRSAYTLTDGDKSKRNRLWQIHPEVEGGRLVSRGVELERGDVEEVSGSMTTIDFGNAKEVFREEFSDTIDPRLGGLEENIADFAGEKFCYPMSLTEKHLSGVNISGDGDVQYVQGLRVGLATESFGYSKPWFSYDFLDSSIIAGRDRSEIKSDIEERIGSFWQHTDNQELLEHLVRVTVHDTKKAQLRGATESKALSKILGYYRENSPETSQMNRVHKIVDEALVRELRLEKHLPTLVISTADQNSNDKTCRDALLYAKQKKYAIKTTVTLISTPALQDFARRLSGDYEVVSINEIINTMKEEGEKEKEEPIVESEEEKEIRHVFLAAVVSVNTFAKKAGMGERTFKLEFERSSWDKEDPYAIINDDTNDSPPIILNSYNNTVCIDSRRIQSPYGDPSALQRQIEIYLLSDFMYPEDHATDDTHDDDDPEAALDDFDFKEDYPKEGGHAGNHSYHDLKDDYLKEEAYYTSDSAHDEEASLKKSQRLLDIIIEKLIPEHSPLLQRIPLDMEYQKDPAVLSRTIELLFGEMGVECERGKKKYATYKKSIDTELTLGDAREILENLEPNSYPIGEIVSGRVFLSDNGFTYYDSPLKQWKTQSLRKENSVATWAGLPVHALSDGRFFIPASMQKGAVLTIGEGKKREYIFSEGRNFLRIGECVQYEKYGYGFPHNSISVHPDGLIIREMKKGSGSKTTTPETYIQEQLVGYAYHPTGENPLEGQMTEGIISTSIPIEYGQDEWDNPIRIFQDIIQNHIDASPDGCKIALYYKVGRDEHTLWVEENDMLPSDTIVGISMKDSGRGYYPDNIATMGASSKRSPLFAGKYGEGQKMIAAAALRNNLELSYQSTIGSDDTDEQSWTARAVKKPVTVVLGGKEVPKELVAFDVGSSPTVPSQPGSSTTLELPLEVSREQEVQWAQWMLMIDPRQKDEKGHCGLARYVRQLRKPNSERVSVVGSISILWDEPGAVYENGLRINEKAENTRSLSFGYDVPEIVTTRERNSYNSDRLVKYFSHAISNITDPLVIEGVLRKFASSKANAPDMDIGVIMSGDNNAAPLWSEVARKVWPDHVVHSQEQLDEDQVVPDIRPDRYSKERAEKAQYIQANMVHIDRDKVLDITKKSYRGFSKLLPTTESVIERMRTEILPLPPAIRKVLCGVVAESANIFIDMLEKDPVGFEAYVRKRIDANAREWNSPDILEENGAVAITPISSAFRGKADMDFDTKVLFNEQSLFVGHRRELAETSLHEMAHIVSEYSDYTEEFVTLLYNLAHHLARATDSN